MKFRIVDRPDGSRECIRVLDKKALRKWTRRDPLGFESSLFWQQPIDSIDFVRVALVRNARSRRGPLSVPEAEWLLGYTTVTDDAPLDTKTQGYTRRVFYLTHQDFELNMNEFPAGALDPSTIFPGVSGKTPDLEQVDRGYPWYLCRTGEIAAPMPSPAVA